MKIYAFERGGIHSVGVELEDGVILDLQKMAGSVAAFATVEALIDGGESALDRVRAMLAAPEDAARVRLDEVRLLAPLPRPRKIRGGSMYDRHLKQAAEGTAQIMSRGHPDPAAALEATRAQLANIPGPGWYAEPAYYLMDATTAIGPDEEVEWPSYSNWIDFELEIGAVLGRPIRDASVEEARDAIFGYILVNDLSARDAQLKAFATGMGAVGKGKEFDGSICLGPRIVTVDEIADPYRLALATRVNGKPIFEGRTEEAPQWRFEQIAAHVSQAQTLETGEILTTGCLPSCCAIEHAVQPARGDVIEIEAEGLGVIRTKIV